MNTGVVITSVSRSSGGLFDAERRLHQTLAATGTVSVQIYGVEDAATASDLELWLPLRPQVFRKAGPAGYCYAPKMSSALMAADLDLLYSAGLWQYPSYLVLRWARKKHRPYIVSPHGMLDPWAVNHARWKKRLAGWLFQDAQLQSATCLRALCDSEAQSIRAYGLKNPICILPNGIDLPDAGGQRAEDREPRTENRLFGGSADRRVLLFLSRIHPKKGLVNLLKAWAEVQRTEGGGRRSEWLLAVAGWDQGGHKAELKQLATDLGLRWADIRSEAGRGDSPAGLGPEPQLSSFKAQGSSYDDVSLLFTGPLFGADKAAAYRACDAFILPSFSEGLPMVVLEAWACGKPVLMTPECNLPEGFAADAAIPIETTPENIAAGLHTLFATPSSGLQAIGARGRALVADRFAWPKIAAQMKEVYDWMLGGGSPPGCVRFD